MVQNLSSVILFSFTMDPCYTHIDLKNTYPFKILPEVTSSVSQSIDCR